MVNEAFLSFFKSNDPDVMVGYEVQMSSWGYLIERGSHIGLDAAPMLSRLPDSQSDSCMADDESR